MTHKSLRILIKEQFDLGRKCLGFNKVGIWISRSIPSKCKIIDISVE